jgi:hypothetical protein
MFLTTDVASSFTTDSPVSLKFGRLAIFSPAAMLAEVFLIHCYQDDAAVAAPLKNASRSALIWSAFVVGMP